MLDWITSDNWNDPVLNWWRDYFGEYGERVGGWAEHPCAEFHNGDPDMYQVWGLFEITTPFHRSAEEDSELFTHLALVGHATDYTRVAIPAAAKHPEYADCEALQKHWLIFGWYKRRGCTEYVVSANFNFPEFGPHGVSFEQLRKLANEWQRPGFSCVEPITKEKSADEVSVFVPAKEQLFKMLGEEAK